MLLKRICEEETVSASWMSGHGVYTHTETAYARGYGSGVGAPAPCVCYSCGRGNGAGSYSNKVGYGGGDTYIIHVDEVMEVG